MSMLTLVAKWLIYGLAIYIVGHFFSGIHIADYRVALIGAAVLGLLNVTIRPFLKVLTFPVTVLTLGLFSLVVNGFTFWLVPKIVKGITIDGFWWAVVGALAISIITTVAERLILGEDGKVGVTSS